MREILFRGKRISDNTWVYGGIMKTFHPNFTHESSEAFALQKENCYCICANRKDYFVEQKSIGQYTGLCDKNGKKIFEGDIVDILTENEEVGVVAYEDGGFLVNADGFSVDFHSNIYGTDLEIIGNIHDNPELLKESESK